MTHLCISPKAFDLGTARTFFLYVATQNSLLYGYILLKSSYAFLFAFYKQNTCEFRISSIVVQVPVKETYRSQTDVFTELKEHFLLFLFKQQGFFLVSRLPIVHPIDFYRSERSNRNAQKKRRGQPSGCSQVGCYQAGQLAPLGPAPPTVPVSNSRVASRVEHNSRVASQPTSVPTNRDTSKACVLRARRNPNTRRASVETRCNHSDTRRTP